eukprot:TRINITY_DN31_c0_g1_i5.p1 TRINITY_DN31_c0_g1~~TRINITY_DN31_c0_g1_i5.p1  ORF type:complete len:447 (+),score=167.24 TRINITY_DN31_c0_g1_i5:84-1424(+)
MPKRVGKYELGKTLGSGSFSKVKEGIDIESGSKYAVKIVDKALLTKGHVEQQLKREIAIMKLLDHPHVLSMIDVLQTGSNIYLVLELLTGGDLFDKLDQAKRFDEPQARTYFQQLVYGLQYLHANDIAHRDLKPENLLLDAEGHLKIADFGFSRLLNNQQLLQTVCGTPNYMAPEVLKERGYNGITADIWSCGVILFVMLAGYLPFDDPNMNALFNKIERGEYRMARHFTDPVKDIISRMLVIEPEKRITLEQIMQHPWFRIDLDESMFKQGTRVQVSKQQVDSAVGTVGEQSGQTERPATASAAGMDAFDLMSRMTQGNLDPITSGASSSVVQVARQTRTIVSIGSAGTSPREAIKRVLCCDALKGNPKDGKDPVEIKGFCNASKGLMTYVCTVCPFIPVKGQLWCFVELRRGRGDTLDFQSFWETFSSLLSKGEGGCSLLCRQR